MMRNAWLAVLIVAPALAACATPEVAEDYEARSYLPAELSAALASEDPTSRADAAGQVEALEPAERRAVLLRLTRDDRATVRLLAVGLLSRHHAPEPEARARLAEVLSLDPDADVRAAAVAGLARSGDAECLPPLVEALSGDASLGVRRACASALDRLSGESHGAAFLSAADEADAAADDAMMAYDDWLETNRDRLRWDGAQGRFRVGR